MTDSTVDSDVTAERRVDELIHPLAGRIEPSTVADKRRFRIPWVESAGLVVGLVSAMSVDAWSLVSVTTSGVLVLTLVLDLASRPVYSRWTSLAPLTRVVALLSVGLLAGVATGTFNTRDVRIGLVTMGAGLAIPMLCRIVRRRRAAPTATLIVGDRVAVSHLLAQWQTSGEVLPVGVCLADPDDDIEQAPTHVMGVPVLGRFEFAARLARQRSVERVVVAPGPALTAYNVRRLGWALEQSRIEMAVAAEIHGAVPRRIEPRMVGGRLMLSVKPPHQSPAAMWLKSVMDRAAGLVLLVIFAPILGLLVTLVRRGSPGPGMFTQVRIGRYGRPFTMYKIRTMYRDADVDKPSLAGLNQGAGLLFKLEDDPRITVMGRLLRRTSLDELPQLINVVRGEMSLIGPRPALPSEVNGYDDWIRRRLTVRPGMTGLWQVSGRSSLAWHRGVRLDLDYVDNWTLVGDMSIAARTFRAVTRRDGAY